MPPPLDCGMSCSSCGDCACPIGIPMASPIMVGIFETSGGRFAICGIGSVDAGCGGAAAYGGFAKLGFSLGGDGNEDKGGGALVFAARACTGSGGGIVLGRCGRAGGGGGSSASGRIG